MDVCLVAELLTPQGGLRREDRRPIRIPLNSVTSVKALGIPLYRRIRTFIPTPVVPIDSILCLESIGKGIRGLCLPGDELCSAQQTVRMNPGSVRR